MSRTALKTVLLIEDNGEESVLITEMIEQERTKKTKKFQLVHVQSVGQAERRLAKQDVDVILLDMGSGSMREQEEAQQIRRVAPRVSLVLLSNQDGEAVAKRAMQNGAQDYLIKGEIRSRELVRALENAIRRKVIEEALFVEKDRAQVTLDSIGDAIISTDAAGKITFLNAVAERLTGWSAPEARRQSMKEVFRIMDATTRETIANPMEMAVRKDRVGHLPGNCILIRRDGAEIYIEDSAAPIHGRDGGIAGSVIVFRDVGSARKAAEQTIHAAQHDFLTGLPNRLLLEDRLGQAIALAERHSGKVAVLYLDLDGFKHINDSLGHLVGDKLLRAVAGRLLEQVRTPDTVSRQGGDEFVVVLQDVRTREDVEAVARRILAAVADVHAIGEHRLALTASLGVSLFPADGRDAETLMKHADTAMYRAKGSGCGGYRFFEGPARTASV